MSGADIVAGGARPDAEPETGAGGLRQISAQLRQPVALISPRRPGIGIRLVAAFGLLALLPLSGMIAGSLGKAGVTQPLAAIEVSSLYFREKDRGFRQGVRRLRRALADPAALGTRLQLERARSEVSASLALTRANLEDMLQAGLLRNRSQLMHEQRDVELGAAVALQYAEQRLSQHDALATALVEASEIEANLRERLADAFAGTPEMPPVIADLLASLDRIQALRAGLATDPLAAAADTVTLATALSQAQTLAEGVPDALLRNNVQQDLAALAARLTGATGLSALAIRAQLHDKRIADQLVDVIARQDVMLDRLLEIDAEVAARTASLLAEAHTGAERGARVSILSGLLAIVMTVLILWGYVYRRLVRRLGQLVTNVTRIRGHNFNEAPPVDGDDELTTLSVAVDDLRRRTLALRDTETALRKCRRDLRTAALERESCALRTAAELRRPVDALHGLSQCVADELGRSPSAAVQQQLGVVKASIGRLQMVADGLQAFAEADLPDESPEPVAIQYLIRECVDALRPPAAQVEVCGADCTITTWRQGLERLLGLLIDNAFRHNDRPDCRLRIDVTVQHRCLRIMLEDDGPGIPPRDQARLFGLLETGAAHAASAGPGLGLATARKLLDHCGGDIRIDSDPAAGRGCRFIVTWPAHTAAAGA